MNDLTHLDLFSGIGGFALAAQWAGFRTIAFCEIEPFCQEVLRKHWPQVPIHDDIKTFRWGGESPTLLTGGVPCQPTSLCGRRRGKADDRYLWDDFFRIISESNPSWVIAENPLGIKTMGLNEILSTLEDGDFEVEVYDIPACAVGRNQERRRVWILAHAKSHGGVPVPIHPITNQEDPETQDNWGIEQPKFHRSILRQPRAFPDPGIHRMVNGFPSAMDKARYHALGNAIVPQVACQIIRAIAEIERMTPCQP